MWKNFYTINNINQKESVIKNKKKTNEKEIYSIWL